MTSLATGSSTAVFTAIVSAIRASEEILGPNRIWTPQNDYQAHFLNEYFSKREELLKLSPTELRNWVSRVAAELNQVAREEGFDITFSPFQPNEFGILSILDVAVSWLTEGKPDKLFNLNTRKLYDAVRMEQFADGDNGPVTNFQVFMSEFHSNPIARVNTVSGDTVWMTVADGPASSFHLLERIKKIKSGIQDTIGEARDHLIFPMADLNQEVNIGWLEGLWTTDDFGVRTEVKKALQQTKFKMNEKGARVKSAVAVTMISLSVGRHIENNLFIDEPFFLWIERERLSMPVLAAYIDVEDWKDPGGLEM